MALTKKALNIDSEVWAVLNKLKNKTRVPVTETIRRAIAGYVDSKLPAADSLMITIISECSFSVTAMLMGGPPSYDIHYAPLIVATFDYGEITSLQIIGDEIGPLLCKPFSPADYSLDNLCGEKLCLCGAKHGDEIPLADILTGAQLDQITTQIFEAMKKKLSKAKRNRRGVAA